jgi:plasmid stability protein
MGVNLSIKDVPDDLAERLRQRAARNHRSLQGELMAIVAQAAGESAPDARQLSALPSVSKPSAAQQWMHGWKTVEQLLAERRATGWAADPSMATAPLGVDIVRGDRDSR